VTLRARLYWPLEVVRELVLRVSARTGAEWGQSGPGNWRFGLELAHYATQVYCTKTPGGIRRARGVKVTLLLGKQSVHWHRTPR
jgi:hypothetical protein